jgi:hypothetical protein
MSSPAAPISRGVLVSFELEITGAQEPECPRLHPSRDVPVTCPLATETKINSDKSGGYRAGDGNIADTHTSDQWDSQEELRMDLDERVAIALIEPSGDAKDALVDVLMAKGLRAVR